MFLFLRLTIYKYRKYIKYKIKLIHFLGSIKFFKNTNLMYVCENIVYIIQNFGVIFIYNI